MQPPAQSLRSELLTRAGFSHAFFTRRGGVSTGPFSSLSFSLSVGDEPAAVQENLSRAGQALGVTASRIYFLSQVHGRIAHIADASQARDDFLHRQGDILLTANTTLACGVRTADCVPVLIADRVSGSVAAVHAGWRGVVAQAVVVGVERLRKLAGDRAELIAAIGPHISLPSFEVSEEVAKELLASSPDPDVVDRSRSRPHVDLARIVRAQLLSVGVKAAAIEQVPGCTVLDADRFFSFRRDGERSGRHLSAIVARGPE